MAEKWAVMPKQDGPLGWGELRRDGVRVGTIEGDAIGVSEPLRDANYGAAPRERQASLNRLLDDLCDAEDDIALGVAQGIDLVLKRLDFVRPAEASS